MNAVKRAGELIEVGAAVRPCPKSVHSSRKSIVKKSRRQKTNRQKLIAQLDDICKQIVAWRDGDRECVMADMVGGECGNGPQWGHVIPRNQSAWLRHSLSNSARQCGTHNKMHFEGDPIFFMWYEQKFGRKALAALRAEAKANADHYRKIPEFREQLEELKRLYDDRFSHGSDTLEELVAAGYFGEIVKKCWTEEGRI